LLLAVGIFVFLVGPSLADPSMTTAFSNMRKTANRHSRIVQAVPANAEVDVQSCGGEWCYASWRGVYGFLPAFAVGHGGPRSAVAAPPPVAFAPPPPPLVTGAPVIAAPAAAYDWSGAYVGIGWGWGRW
jgi:hypothetical protein